MSLSETDITNIKNFVTAQFYETMRSEGVEPTESDEKAKKVYHTLALLYHPDKCIVKDLPLGLNMGKGVASTLEKSLKKEVCDRLFKELGIVYKDFKTMDSDLSQRQKAKAKKSTPKPKTKKTTVAKTKVPKIYKGWKEYLYDPDIPLGRAFLEELGIFPAEEVIFESVSSAPVKTEEPLGYRLFKRKTGLPEDEALEAWRDLVQNTKDEYKREELEARYEPLIKEYMKDIGATVSERAFQFMN